MLSYLNVLRGRKIVSREADWQVLSSDIILINAAFPNQRRVRIFYGPMALCGGFTGHFNCTLNFHYVCFNERYDDLYSGKGRSDRIHYQTVTSKDP